MNRAIGVALVVILSGCSLPPERAAVRPLAEDSPPQTYADLLSRARVQATSATEAFYINEWMQLDELARNLEQTGRFLAKATEVPPKHKDRLKAESTALESEARRLQEAAKARDEAKTNEVMQKINLLVRELRTDG
jgi:hypothetical protein